MYKNYIYIFSNLQVDENSDTSTVQSILGELALTNVSFTKELNAAGTLTGELLISGIDTTALNVFTATEPSAVGVTVYENGTPIWGGVVWSRSYDSTTQKLTLTANEYISYWGKRKTLWQCNPVLIVGSGTAITYTAGGFIVGQTVTITGANPNTYNLTGVVTSATSFSFDIAGTITTAFVAPASSVVTGGVGSGTAVTYTTSSAHGYVTGQVVRVFSGLIGSNIWNLTGIITAKTTNTFTITNQTAGSYSATGSAIVDYPVAIAQEAVFTNADQFTVVKALVNASKSAVFGDIQIQNYSGANSGVTISKTYYSYEMKTILSAIDDLSKSGNGFDYEVEVYATTTSGITRTHKRLNLYYPRKGAIYSSTSTNPLVPVLEFPAGNVVSYEYPEDGILATNTFYAIGAGSNEGQLIATSTNAAVLGDSISGYGFYPVLEDSGNYSDITDGALLGLISQSSVTNLSYPPVVIKMIVSGAAQDTPYIIGDDARVRIKDARFPYGFDEIFRIVAITVEPGEDGPERITLTLANPTGEVVG